MKFQRMAETHEGGLPPIVLYDRYLLLATIALLAFGLLMVASTSIAVSQHIYHQPFHYLIRQLCYLLLGIVLAIVIFRIPLMQWQKFSMGLLLLSLILLILVLVPKIGREVNGSMRWLGFGPFGLQVSEFAKLAVIIYLADYLMRHDVEVRTRLSGFLKPLFLLGLVAALLLREPDFGATAVILATCMGMLFLAGVRLWPFAVLFCGVAASLTTLAITSPYRLLRLTTFLNPWATQYDTGYQLTQSLIAFGRGSWTGVGLGESVQKLFYLPEAHTDFLFAVLTEELGLIGGLVVIALFAIVVIRALQIGRKAYLEKRLFAAYLAYGFGLELAMQVLINIGVNAGVLPTKGLTLPFMSYGGSSLLIMCGMVAILLRIDYESRLAMFGMRVTPTK
jgi:cell division protein FtsW